jgi:hypothetical protein
MMGAGRVERPGLARRTEPPERARARPAPLPELPFPCPNHRRPRGGGVALRAVADGARHPRDGAPAWPDGAPVHTFTVPGGVGAPAAARLAVRGLLQFHLNARAQTDATLLISELVANAVLHGGARETEDICLRLAFARAGPCLRSATQGRGSKRRAFPKLDPVAAVWGSCWWTPSAAPGASTFEAAHGCGLRWPTDASTGPGGRGCLAAVERLEE